MTMSDDDTEAIDAAHQEVGNCTDLSAPEKDAHHGLLRAAASSADPAVRELCIAFTRRAARTPATMRAFAAEAADGAVRRYRAACPMLGPDGRPREMPKLKPPPAAVGAKIASTIAGVRLVSEAIRPIAWPAAVLGVACAFAPRGLDLIDRIVALFK